MREDWCLRWAAADAALAADMMNTIRRDATTQRVQQLPSGTDGWHRNLSAQTPTGLSAHVVLIVTKNKTLQQFTLCLTNQLHLR